MASQLECVKVSCKPVVSPGCTGAGGLQTSGVPVGLGVGRLQTNGVLVELVQLAANQWPKQHSGVGTAGR